MARQSASSRRDILNVCVEWNDMEFNTHKCCSLFEMKFLTVLNQRRLYIIFVFRFFLCSFLNTLVFYACDCLCTVYMCMHMHYTCSSKSIDSFSDIK